MQDIYRSDLKQHKKFASALTHRGDPCERPVPACTTKADNGSWRRKKSGQVTALEKVSLFELVIAADRRVNYGRINTKTAQEAREIFIRDALISGELNGTYPFLQHNLALAKNMAEMEERLRRRGIMTDEQVLYDFYDQRLGPVYDRFTLNQFTRRVMITTFPLDFPVGRVMNDHIL